MLDSHRAVTVSSDNVARAWDLGTGTALASMALDSGPTALAVTHDHCILIGHFDGSVDLWEIREG